MKVIARNAMRAYRGVMVVATGSTLRVLQKVYKILQSFLITRLYLNFYKLFILSVCLMGFQ